MQLFVVADDSIEGDVIGNFIVFKDCVFEGNRAIEQGGAVGLSLTAFNIAFSNRENLTPVDIESW